MREQQEKARTSFDVRAGKRWLLSAKFLFREKRDEVLRTGDVNVVVDDHVVAH